MTDRLDEARDLLETAKSNPAAVDVDLARELLDDDDSTVRNVALKVLATTAVQEPDRVAPVTDRVVDALDDPFPVTSTTAAGALSVIGQTHPEAVRPAVPALIDQLDDDVPQFRFRAAGAIAAVADAYPDAFVDHGDELLDVLVDGPTVDTDVDAFEGLKDPVGGPSPIRDDTIRSQIEQDEQQSQSAREIAASVLVDVAERSPTVFERRLSDVVSLTTDSSPIVRGAMLEVVAEVAAADPDAVAPATDAILARLDDEAEFVRASAIQALGAATVVEAIDDLREVADTDPVDEIADLAAATADELDRAA